MITVYGLTDENGQIRYVGQTQDCKGRFAEHLRVPRKHPFPIAGMAMLSLTENGRIACRDERRWIAFFGVENLWNHNRGQRRVGRKGLTSFVSVRLPVGTIDRLRDIAGPYGLVHKFIRHLIEKALNGK